MVHIMAGDAFQKIKSSFNRGITTISVKTSSSLEKTKIKTHIESITREIQRKFSLVGEEAYKIWSDGSEDFSALYQNFEEIKNKYNEIEELKEQLVYIDQRDNEILGNTAKEASAAEQIPVAAEEPEATQEEQVEEVKDEPKAEEPEVEVEEKTETEDSNAEEPKEEPETEQPKKRFCRNCGTPYEGSIKFCRNCGTQINVL